MIKKIFSLFILFVIITNSLNTSYANLDTINSSIQTEMSISKSKIKKLKNWSRYIIQLNKVDKYIDSQTNVELLNKLKNKVDTKKDSITPSILWWESSNDLILELLNYISLKLDDRIEKLDVLDKQKTIDLLNNPELSTEEIKKVESEIVKIQLNLLDSSKSIIDKLVSDLQKSINVEETWNLKINIEWSGSIIWNAKWSLSIKDYKSKTLNFDSEFKAQVDLLVDASLRWIPELKTQFSSFVNFISKDWNFYILLEKLQYSWIDNSELNSYLSKLKELANNSEYLKIEDKESTKYINLIKSFNINSLYSETNKILLAPMLTPYKKEWDKYLLLPKKEMCDAIKKISYKINNRWTWSCSDSEYNNMLKESLKNWNLYIIIDWNDRHLWLDMNDNFTNWYIKVYYQDKKINKILANIQSKTVKTNWWYIDFIFINWQKLDLVMDIKSEDILLSFKSVLSSDNKFNKINYIWNFTPDFSSNFNLENKKFDWNFIATLKTYNYDNNTNKYWYVKSWELKWTLNWSLNSENTLTSVDFVISWNESKERYNYDWETWKSTNSTVTTNFDLDYKLSNELITWNIIYKEDNKEIFSVKSNWKYKKEYFELNNIVNLVNPMMTSSDKINSNINTKFEGTLNKNNFYFYFDINYPNYGNLKFDLTSDYSKSSTTDSQINTPSKYKTIEEVFPKNKESSNEFFQ